MNGLAFWFTLIVGGAMTFVMRWSFIAVSDLLELPEALRRALRFVPVAVFSAIAWPAILIGPHGMAIGAGNLQLWAAALATAVAWYTRSVLYTVVVGMASFWLLHGVLG